MGLALLGSAGLIGGETVKGLQVASLQGEILGCW